MALRGSSRAGPVRSPPPAGTRGSSRALPTQHSHEGKAQAGQACLGCLLIKCCFRGNG